MMNAQSLTTEQFYVARCPSCGYPHRNGEACPDDAPKAADGMCDGEIGYRGDPYNVDADGYYCTVCGTTGDEDSRVAWKSGESVAHRKGVGGYERDVVDAALAYARIPTHIDHREESEAAEEVVREAARALLKARGE